MGRTPCCDKVGLKKGPWTPEEDQKLLAYIQEHGHGSWRALPPKAGLQRCGKSCRLRWTNYLRPDIKRGKFTLQEEQTIIQLHALLGNRWAAIASHLPKRTDNEIKNYWNTHLKKRLTKMGIDPVTHKPKNHALGSCGQIRDMANLSHMAQWESARLEAEARIVRESWNTTPQNPNHQQSQLALINKARSMMIPRPPCLDVLKVWQQRSWSTNPRQTMPINSLIASNNDPLESPTSILNFSANALNSTNNPNVGLAKAINYSNNYVGANDNNYNNYNNQDEAKGLISGSLMEICDGGMMGTTFLGDLPEFPSFNMGGFTGLCENDVGANNSDNLGVVCGGVIEDDKVNYWSNILNIVVPSPMHSPVF